MTFMKNWKIVTLYLMAILLITFSFFMHLHYKSFSRVFDEDELITLKYYTLAGSYDNGKERKIEHVSDIEKIQKPSLKHLLIGLYCSIGRWTEPNNHVLNSTFVNFTFFSKNRTESIIRIPAFVGFILLSVLYIFLLNTILKFKPLTVFITLPMLLFNPYVIHYSVTSRGYIWMLFLQIVGLIILYLIKQKPLSISLAVLAVTTFFVSTVNVISTLTFLVIPIYLTILYYFLIDAKKSIIGKEIKFLLVHILVLVSLLGIFIFDRLPYILSSSNQYGISFNTLSGFFNNVGMIILNYCPSISWKIILILSALGYVFSLKNNKNNVFSILIIFTALITLLQAIISHKFGYERVYGFFVIFLVIGVSLLLELIVNGKSKYLKIGFIGLLIVLCFNIVRQSKFDLNDHQSDLFVNAVSKIKCSRDTNYIPILLQNIPKANSLYFPENLFLDFTIKNDANSKICLLYKDVKRRNKMSNVKASLIDNICSYYNLDTIVNLSNTYFCLTMNGVFKKISDSLVLNMEDDRIAVFWNPPFEVVSLSPDTITSFLDRMHVNYYENNRRYNAKMEVFSRLNTVIIFPYSNADLNNVVKTTKMAIAKFGGDASIFIEND